MAKLAGAFGVSHIMFNRNDDPAMGDQVFAGYAEVGRRVRDSRPDLIVMISGDHMLNLDSGCHVPFAVGIGDEWMPFRDMGVPIVPRPGHRAFAEGLVHFLAENDFDVTTLEPHGFRPDHGYTCPMLFADNRYSIPYVPIHINTNMDPVPSARRCWEFGRLIRRYIDERRPATERIVIEATGGLSHWLMIEGDGKISEEFDTWVLDRFAAGDIESLQSLTNAEIRERGGNGGLELLYWLAMAAAAGPFTRAEKLFYVPMHPWKTGLGGVAVEPA